MNTYFYTTIENQQRSDGSFGLLYDHFYEMEGYPSALNRAQAKYHTVCAAAAISDIPYHSAMLIRSDHVVLESAVWDRRVEESESFEEPTEE